MIATMKHTSLNIDIDEYGNRTVVPVRCGRNRGTAFFVGTNQLLTATHIIGPHISNRTGCKIQVFIDDEWQDCDIAFQYDKADVVLLNCTIANPKECCLKLISSDCPTGEDLLVLGFPEEIGNGIDYFGVKVRNSRHLRKSGKDDISRGFNVVVIRTDLLEFASYSGFSGSPVLNSRGEVVGIATDQFYNSLGYTSIRILEEEAEFLQFGICVDKCDVDTTQFGLTTAANILIEKLKIAGNRYSPETHVDDVETNERLAAFCNIDTQSRRNEVSDLCRKIYKEAKGELKKYVESKNYKEEDREIKSFQTTGVLSYSLLSELDEIQYYRPEYSNECALVNPLRKDVEKAYNLLQSVLDCEELEKAHFLYVTGLAGQGKTHTLCRFADCNKGICSYYLFFGSDFGSDEPVTTILSLLEWQDGDLQKLNKYVSSKNQYAIFIIDGINEGSGSEYWRTKIEALRSEFAKYDRLKLILSFRTMPETDDLKGQLRSEWLNIDIAGFKNTRDAIDIHFRHNNIDEDTIKFATLPEFQSPLYLRIFCEVYHMLPYRRRERYTRDIIYMAYLRKRNIKISEAVDEDPTEQVTCRYVLNLAKLSVDEGLCFDIPRDRALSLANDICQMRLWSKNLMNNLIKENILKEYTLRSGIRLIDFEFDSIGDYLKMCHIREMNDELIIRYIAKAMNYLQSKGMGAIERSHFSNVLTFLFAEWNPSAAIWKELLNDREFKKYFMRSISLRYEDEEYSSILTSIISDIIDKDKTYYKPEYLLDNFDTYKYGILTLVHDKLKDMKMSKRDEVWTIEVNELYDRHSLISKLSNLCDVQQQEYAKELSVLIGWFLTTSYPSLHAKLVMKLRDLYRMDLALIVSVAKCFDEVDDPYIHQGLYAAGYAALVLARDNDKSVEVADYIRSKYYSDKTMAPSDIVVRNWTLKIIELASILDNTYAGWSTVKTLMPFTSKKNPFDGVDQEAVRMDDYFGNKPGAKAIHTSLFAWDFYRYILGANNNTYSPVFADSKRPVDKIKELNREGDVKIDDIADAIAVLIKDKYMYSDTLGEYDKSVYHGDRYDNNKERIGKKYQWLGYFEVLSYLCDNYKIVLDRWCTDAKFVALPYPWLTGEIPYTDPTIGLEESLSILSREMFEAIPDDFVSIADPHLWLNDDLQLPSILLLLTDRNIADEWVVLSPFDTQTVYSNNLQCSSTVWYHAVLVKKSESQKFEEWCKKDKNYEQEFWANGEYEYHWNDYPYTSSYKDRSHEILHDWSAPCDVKRATVIQLQEDFTGCYASSEFIRECEAPCVDMMESLNLYTAERGVVRRNNGEIAAININSTSSRMSGLVMKRKLLNQFLDSQGMNLYYLITIRKELTTKSNFVGESKYHKVSKYVNDAEAIDIVPLTKYV